MKVRNPLTPRIKPIHSRWFWHQCSKCNIEFKDVDMWKYSYDIISAEDIVNYNSYSCTKCSPTKEDAIKNLMSIEDYSAFLKVEKKIKEMK